MTTTLSKTYNRRLRRQMRENRDYIFNNLYATTAIKVTTKATTTTATDASITSQAITETGCDSGVDVSDPRSADARLQSVVARAYEIESERRCERARSLYDAALERADVAMEAVEGFDRVIVDLPGRVGEVLRGVEKKRDGKDEDDDDEEEGEHGEGFNVEVGKETDGDDNEQSGHSSVGDLSPYPGCREGKFDLAGKLLRDSLALKEKIEGVLEEGEKKRRREDSQGRFEYDMVEVSLRHSLMLQRRLDAMYQEVRHKVEA